jgi:acetate kinase
MDVARHHRMTRHALALNAGSSTLKAALFDDASHEVDRTLVEGRDVEAVMEWINSSGYPAPDVVGHRMVHGGERFRGPALIGDEARQQLQNLTSLAPLHMPLALEVVDAARKVFDGIPHTASFDTAFHHTLQREAYDFPLPRDLVAQFGLRRYGFHGLNCQHVVDSVGAETLGRTVIAHLGSGCSLTAVANGKSVDTTMGFTPLGGIPMATRTGDLDPGLLVHLLRNGLDVDTLEDALLHRSGIAGWSGTNGDLRNVTASDDPDAHFTLDAFCTRIAMAAAALVVRLGGLDTLVFTGGIGEHQAIVREKVEQQLQPLGAFRSIVVPANEESVIAREAQEITPDTTK